MRKSMANRKPQVDEDMLARVAGGAAAGAGMLMVHVVAALAKQPGVDRAALLRDIEGLPSPPGDSPSGAIYNELKAQLIKQLTQ
jgi:hypothetical protein